MGSQQANPHAIIMHDVHLHTSKAQHVNYLTAQHSARVASNLSDPSPNLCRLVRMVRVGKQSAASESKRCHPAPLTLQKHINIAQHARVARNLSDQP